MKIVLKVLAFRPIFGTDFFFKIIGEPCESPINLYKLQANYITQFKGQAFYFESMLSFSQDLLYNRQIYLNKDGSFTVLPK